jgi:hypothetical protein
MRTDGNPMYAQAEAAYLERKATSVQHLNERIARLAIALGLSLDRPGEVDRIIEQVHPAPEPPSLPFEGDERRSQPIPFSGPERRKNYLFDELRGLLVLRFEVERAYAAEWGPHAMLSMLEHAEATLERNGFSTGADGQQLNP